MEIAIIIIVLGFIYMHYKNNKKEDSLKSSSYRESYDYSIEKNSVDKNLARTDNTLIKRKIINVNELDQILSFENSDRNNGEFLVFDLETTGLIKSKKAIPEYEPEKFPYIVQIS